MTLNNRIFNVLISPRRVPIRVLLITALASCALEVGAVVQGQPLYIIALFTLLPWIPILCFESIWKIDHYGWFAIFGIIVVLQLGHLGEHIMQVTQLGWLNGTLACPPPVDTAPLAERAVASGLRSPDQLPTGSSTSWVVKADKVTGLPGLNANGEPTIGPAACGVFGQLDLEIVHLIWEVSGWLATLLLLVKFSRNVWLWIALVFVTIHSVEHLFISWVFFMETDALYSGFKQLWATTVEGKIVTAYPAGLEPQVVTFYEAGGKNGVLAKGGLVDVLLNNPNSYLPTRPYLHFWYNFIVFVPTAAAFFVQVKQVYDEYLAKALPELTEAQLVGTTPKLMQERFKAGTIIITEGEPADRFYIITKGEAEVIKKQPNGKEIVVNRLTAGQFFGEIGLMQSTERVATVRAATPLEVICLDQQDFIHLMDDSDNSRLEVERLISRRVEQLMASQK